jgi:hypothetical protein
MYFGTWKQQQQKQYHHHRPQRQKEEDGSRRIQQDPGQDAQARRGDGSRTYLFSALMRHFLQKLQQFSSHIRFTSMLFINISTLSHI